MGSTQIFLASTGHTTAVTLPQSLMLLHHTQGAEYPVNPRFHTLSAVEFSVPVQGLVTLYNCSSSYVSAN